MEIRFVASLLHHPRVGIIVPRHKHSAVDRNLVKRRLREIARLRLLPLLGDAPLDVVVRAQPAAYGAAFAALEEELVRATRRLAGGGPKARPARDVPPPSSASPASPASPPAPVDGDRSEPGGTDAETGRES